MTTFQLRRYQIKPGEMDAFLEAWRGIIPLREKFGFRPLFAFVNEADDEFTWAVAHDGDFAQAEKDYYASPEKAALANPAEHVAKPVTAFVTAEMLPGQ